MKLQISSILHLVRITLFVGVSRNDRQDSSLAKTAQGAGNLAGSRSKYEKAHPGVKIEFDYLENEAFKAKLPTLLQSKDRPSMFHSWGGGVMYEQINSGVCQDITKAISEGGFKDTFYPAGIQNFTYQGKTYGLPLDVAPMVFWYNKELVEKAGVDPTKIKYWERFHRCSEKMPGCRDHAASGGRKRQMASPFLSRVAHDAHHG